MADSQKPDKLNLDLINRVQNARMQHDADAIPSQVPGVYWIEAKAQETSAQPTPRTGEWRIVTTAERVDEDWAAIKAATQRGELGYKSKVSTYPAHEQRDDQRMICVRTYDADDQADVERVRQAILALALTPADYVRD